MTDPVTIAPAVGGPACGACGAPSRVHWLRRLTPGEIAEQQAIEQARRDQALALADPALPPPVFGPEPDYGTWTRAVYGCIHHAITKDAAALVHQAGCPAPDPGRLPECGCTPEPPPAPEPEPDPEPLPPGW